MWTTMAIALLVLGLSACGHDDAGTTTTMPGLGKGPYERAIEAATGHAASKFYIDAAGYPSVQLRKGAVAAKVGPQVCAAITQSGGRFGSSGQAHVVLRAADGTESAWDCK